MNAPARPAAQRQTARFRSGARGASWCLLALALSRPAFAETCVAIDEERDTLSEEERQAARSLFEGALREAGEAVSRTRCTAHWSLYHVRLGQSVTAFATSPSGVRHRRVERIEDLPAAYSQLAKALRYGFSDDNDSGAMTRKNVTGPQVAPARVEADALWYLKIGYAGGLAQELDTGPAFGFGRRWELDRFALDVSFLEFSAIDSDNFMAEYVGISALHFLAPQANHSGYLGLGLGLGSQTFAQGSIEGNGFLHGKVVAGYELFRASTLRLFTQVDVKLPFYAAGGETESDRYVPVFGLSLGAGWSR